MGHRGIWNELAVATNATASARFHRLAELLVERSACGAVGLMGVSSGDREHVPLARLTPREVEVLSRVRDGLGNADIAEDLVLSQRTVTTHIENILRKLGASNRTKAAVLAERFGLGEDPATRLPALPVVGAEAEARMH